MVQYLYKTVTIASGESLSGSIDFSSFTPVALVMPSAWTAASITFQASHNNSTWGNIYDKDGTEYTLTTAASRYVLLNPADFASVRGLKVRSGTAASAVNQEAARTITLVLREV